MLFLVPPTSLLHINLSYFQLVFKILTRCKLTNLYFNLTAANEATIHATLLLFVLGSEDATIPEAVAEVEDRYRREGETWHIAARRTTPLAGGR